MQNVREKNLKFPRDEILEKSRLELVHVHCIVGSYLDRIQNRNFHSFVMILKVMSSRQLACGIQNSQHFALIVFLSSAMKVMQVISTLPLLYS